MQDQETRNYEIGFLAKEVAGAGETAKLVAHHGGTMLLEGPVEHLPLAYPIKKQSEAHFGYLHFSMKPEDVKKFDEELGRSPAILRFLIVTPPIPKTRPNPMMMPKERMRGAPRPEMRVEKPAAPSPLSNEALEKKIQEILE